ncbi:hypothetical protein F441_01542 [Phytophthora nicotianae CJ01A1]|uniref:Uncharacterized protein n=4 Tax=Phytophthora nicotianae TaxID=4792 RepID=V9FWD7_PHYNI|nr:hypothetical protein F443_01571 [Phytophthora nicotianae P1569]ETK95600.1 hypothetical protein L915_01498 [Phytophthora nicotianae]ETP25606.1 hypothetical protein F441_01542 [Phytophthora nicotianae CJ01A1]ETP53608.1 hypothetical protein F442_01521 [Phytophthora nicotianae P10297]ETL48988.1 hypothetical protein L916_01470 [Phytophthora nicotianae]
MPHLDPDPALKAAAANDHANVVDNLLTETHPTGREAFVEAVARNNMEVVKLFLRKGYPADSWCIGEALNKAAAAGHKRIVELLLEKTDDWFVGKALCTATEAGCTDFVALLLSRYEHEFMSLGDSVKTAASNNHYEVVELLLQPKLSIMEGSKVKTVSFLLDGGQEKYTAYLGFKIRRAIQAIAPFRRLEMAKLLTTNCS